MPLSMSAHGCLVYKVISRVVVLPHAVSPKLNCTSRNHLLAQVVLVLADRAIPLLDGLVLAHENLFRNLVEQPT